MIILLYDYIQFYSFTVGRRSTLKLKKKHGKDWKEIMTDDRRFRR